LLLDVMAGDATLFMRADQVDEAWQIVMPILDQWAAQTDPAAMPIYEPGSWGPDQSTAMIEKNGFNWMNE
ncbi:MAG: glucose-6-phosphate dehydrogenase, partial [Cytophagaceae bacterium]